MNLVKFPGQYLGYCCGRKKNSATLAQRITWEGKASKLALSTPHLTFFSAYHDGADSVSKG